MKSTLTHTSVEQIGLFDVESAEMSVTEGPDICFLSPDSHAVVLGEGLGAIMHHRMVIILYSKAVDFPIAVFGECESKPC